MWQHYGSRGQRHIWSTNLNAKLQELL